MCWCRIMTFSLPTLYWFLSFSIGMGVWHYLLVLSCATRKCSSAAYHSSYSLCRGTPSLKIPSASFSAPPQSASNFVKRQREWDLKVWRRTTNTALGLQILFHPTCLLTTGREVMSACSTRLCFALCSNNLFCKLQTGLKEVRDIF